jgi:hypothetical protein
MHGPIYLFLNLVITRQDLSKTLIEKLKWYLSEQQKKKSIRMSYAQTHPQASTFIANKILKYNTHYETR